MLDIYPCIIMGILRSNCSLLVVKLRKALGVFSSLHRKRQKKTDRAQPYRLTCRCSSAVCAVSTCLVAQFPNLTISHLKLKPLKEQGSGM